MGGQHVVRLTVSEGEAGICTVDAFQVDASSPPSFPLPLVALLGAVLVVTGVALVWDLRNQPRRQKLF